MSSIDLTYLAEFGTRFATLTQTYGEFNLLYDMASEDTSLLSNETWKANMNTALDSLGTHVESLSQIAPVPPALEALDDTIGALSTAARSAVT